MVQPAVLSRASGFTVKSLDLGLQVIIIRFRVYSTAARTGLGGKAFQTPALFLGEPSR